MIRGNVILLCLVASNAYAGWISPESYKEMIPNYFLQYMVNPAHRVPTYPYITGDTFRDYCDFVLDETNLAFNPDDVKEGSTIFLTASPFILTEFFKYCHPKIQHRYIIVTHNHDFWMPAEFGHYLDDPKIIAWFTKNTDRIHPKLIPLPIGIPNPVWTNDGYCNPNIFEKAINSTVPLTQRTRLVYLNISLHTNAPERSKVLNHFRHLPFCFNAPRRQSAEYLAEMKQYAFVLSPPGNGFDCFRTWEALMLGCIVIMKHSPIDSLFEDLPVILVHDWSEVNQALLDTKFNEFASKEFNRDKLYIDYWLRKIDAFKTA